MSESRKARQDRKTYSIFKKGMLVSNLLKDICNNDSEALKLLEMVKADYKDTNFNTQQVTIV
jgi:hypothetical protein